MFKVPLDKD